MWGGSLQACEVCRLGDAQVMQCEESESGGLLANCCPSSACMCRYVGGVCVTFSFPCSADVCCQVSDPVLLVTVTSCKCMERLLCVVDLKRYLFGCRGTWQRGTVMECE